MSTNEIIHNTLKEYNFQLTDFGVECISFQVELLYGKHPTKSQVEDVVRSNSIGFLNEMRK